MHLPALPPFFQINMKTRHSEPFGLFGCLSLLILCLLAAHDALAGGRPKSGTAAETPAKLYQSYCSVCHGDAGDGRSRARASLNPPPVDFTLPDLAATLTRERMILVVREGEPGTAMVGWKTQLSDAQIATIVDFVRDKFMKSNVKQAAGNPLPASPHKSATVASVAGTTVAAPAPFKGDRQAGQRLYEQNCIACHGTAGDGNGPRAYFISPRPRSFVSAESRAAFSRPILIQSIAQGKRGTEMPSWDKVLTPQEIANVAEYVFQRFITMDKTIGTREKK